MRQAGLLALCLLVLQGCGIILFPVRVVEAAGSGAIRSVTPDSSDMR